MSISNFTAHHNTHHNHQSTTNLERRLPPHTSYLLHVAGTTQAGSNHTPTIGAARRCLHCSHLLDVRELGTKLSTAGFSAHSKRAGFTQFIITCIELSAFSSTCIDSNVAYLPQNIDTFSPAQLGGVYAPSNKVPPQMYKKRSRLDA